MLAADAADSAGLIDRTARGIILQRLDGLQTGALQIDEGSRSTVFGTGESGPGARLRIIDPSTYRQLLTGGTIGAAEAYVAGHWECDDLTSLVRVFVANRALLEGTDDGWARLTTPVRRILHALNRNTRGGSRRNIAAHYDLGTEFYALWLDPTMMYSSAWYPAASSTLHEASSAKLDRICRKLELDPSDHVVEIGTGWGGFAEHAARHFGCRVTTTTISQQQHEFATRRIRDAGLADRVTVLNRDYRDLDGQFDKLVSIEMIEAVGHQYHARFFAKCQSLLKANGLMLLQAITIADQYYRRYLRNVDFIRRYIFPGGCLLSLTAMCGTLTRHTDLRAVDIEDIGPHYSRTLRDWRAAFEDRIDEVRALGFDETFIRLWRYYLCYCEGAFIERAIGDVQMLLMRPDARPATAHR